jgi:hypothetical protein
VTTRATRRRVRLALVVLGGVGPVLTSCGGAAPTDEGVGRSEPPAPSTSPSAGVQVEGDNQEATGSFDDVADPATMALPAKGMDALDALADVQVWAGSTFVVSDEQVTADLVQDGVEVAVVIQSDQVLAEPSSRDELDYWLEHTTLVDRPREVAPVVVAGVEVLRAQGEGGLGWIDHFVRGNGELTATFDFILPRDMPAAEREEYVAQVMSTIRFAPELL